MIRKRVSLKTAIAVGIVEVIAMLLLFIVIDHYLTEILRAKAISDMEVIATGRAQLVETYINDCCDFLSGYSRSTEIIEVLENSTDPVCIKKAAEFTDRYAEGYSDIEGLYVAQWDTYVLAHVNPDSVAQTFRDEDSARELEELIRSHDMPFCTGIVMAPVTKKMVIPVYAPVFDKNKNAIGFAGAAFYSDLLSHSLQKLINDGASSTGYALINVSDDIYIFNDDASLVGQRCEDPQLLHAIELLETGDTHDNSYSYSSDGIVTSCHYMFDRNWVFVITDTSEDVFGTIQTIRLVLLLICLFIAIGMVVICVISVEHQMLPLKAINDHIERLKAGDYTHDKTIRKYRNRADEFGSISNAVAELHLVLESQYELFMDVFEAQTVGTLVIGEQNNLVMINDTAVRLCDLDPSEKEDLSVDDLRKHLPEDELRSVLDIREQLKSTDNEIVFETKLTHNDGSMIHVLCHSKSVRLSNGETVIIYSIIDISARKRLEEDITAMSRTDSLTGVMNRTIGENKIENLLREGYRGVFCLFDVNKLGRINDMFGHTAGDHVLIAIADTMRKTFRNSDVLIRPGGDEFIIFATNIASLETATAVLERFLDNIAKIDLPQAGREKISVSLGAVMVTDYEPFSKLYSKADSLIYDCKTKGGNSYAFYE